MTVTNNSNNFKARHLFLKEVTVTNERDADGEEMSEVKSVSIAKGAPQSLRVVANRQFIKQR